MVPMKKHGKPAGRRLVKAVGLGQCSLDCITIVEGFPAEDTKKEVSDLVVQGGGPVATALVALSRLGVKTSFMGRVSDDHAGAEIRKGLRAEGVGTKGLLVKKGGKSQSAFIVVNSKNASRTILWSRPTVEPLAASEVDPALLRSASILLLDGLMMEASVRAASIATEMGIPVMLDGGRVRPGMLKLAAMCDYVVCSEEFASGMKTGVEEALKKLMRGRTRAVTITLGKKGSVTLHEGRVFTRKACKVKAVDTTGAGDVFHGAYAYGVINGWDIEKTVEFASVVAAMKCQKPGGRTGIPTLEEAMGFWKGRER